MSEEGLIPELEVFIDKLYNLYPQGNAEQQYSLLGQYLGSKLPTGETLTFELLCKRYSEYVAFLKPYNNVKDKQYIKKDKEIKHVGGYLVGRLFISDYGASCLHPSDHYLFGI